MRLSTPMAMQGPDIIQVSYGWHEGSLYRRTYDQADRSEVWHRADDKSAARLADEGYDAGGAVHAPRVTSWNECTDPDLSAAARELGRRGGKVGGTARTPAKAAAARANGAKGGRPQVTHYACSECGNAIERGEPGWEDWSCPEHPGAAVDSIAGAAPGSRRWCLDAEPGDYLALYEDHDGGGDGARCGYGDNELSDIRGRLEDRGLQLVADDRGLVVRARRATAARCAGGRRRPKTPAGRRGARIPEVTLARAGSLTRGRRSELPSRIFCPSAKKGGGK